MVMWSLARDFFLSPKAEFSPVFFNGLVGIVRKDRREERSLMMCRQDGSGFGLTSAGVS